MLICEIGQNFMGSMELAYQLIENAKSGGADLAKFQNYLRKIVKIVGYR